MIPSGGECSSAAIEMRQHSAHGRAMRKALDQIPVPICKGAHGPEKESQNNRICTNKLLGAPCGHCRCHIGSPLQDVDLLQGGVKTTALSKTVPLLGGRHFQSEPVAVMLETNPQCYWSMQLVLLTASLRSYSANMETKISYETSKLHRWQCLQTIRRSPHY